MRGAVARIGAESVCLLFGAGLLPWLEKFRCLCAAITANPLRLALHGWRVRFFDLIQCGEPQSSSASRFTAGAFGFLIFTRCGDLPERQVEPSRFEKACPRSQACRPRAEHNRAILRETLVEQH